MKGSDAILTYVKELNCLHATLEPQYFRDAPNNLSSHIKQRNPARLSWARNGWSNVRLIQPP